MIAVACNLSIDRWCASWRYGDHRPLCQGLCLLYLLRRALHDVSFVMNNLLRFEGLAFYGMIGIASGGILNRRWTRC